MEQQQGDHCSVIYGVHFPNRLFVGCLPPKATADHLGKFFSYFGKVIETKVVLDDQKRSKRFGFVSFSKAEEAKRVLNHGTIYLMGKKINVGPAVKKESSQILPANVPVRIVTSTPVNSFDVKTSSCKPKYTYTFPHYDNHYGSPSCESSPAPSPPPLTSSLVPQSMQQNSGRVYTPVRSSLPPSPPRISYMSDFDFQERRVVYMPIGPASSQCLFIPSY